MGHKYSQLLLSCSELGSARPPSMNFKRIAATALPALAFALMPSASLATTSTTVFSATVDQNCNFTAVDEAVALTLNSDGDTLSGTTDTLTIQCNYGVEVDLAMTVNTNNPEETTNTLTVTGGSGAISANNDGHYELGNTSGVASNFTLGLSAAQASSQQLAPGDYEYTVVMTLVAV